MIKFFRSIFTWLLRNKHFFWRLIKHSFCAILLVILTYLLWLFIHKSACYGGEVRIFSSHIDLCSNSLPFKIIAFTANITGALLLLIDTHHRFKAIKGKGILKSFISSYTPFKRDIELTPESGHFNYNSQLKAEWPLFSVSTNQETLAKQSIDTRLARLEELVNTNRNSISDLSSRLEESKSKNQMKLDEVTNAIEQDFKEKYNFMHEKMIDAFASGLTRPIWSIYLMIYAAAVNVMI